MNTTELYSALIAIAQDMEAKLDRKEEFTEKEVRRIARTLTAIAGWIGEDIDDYKDR